MLIQRRQSGSGYIGGGPGDATGASRRHDPLSGRHAAPRQTHLHVLCPHLVKATHTSAEHGRPVTDNRHIVVNNSIHLVVYIFENLPYCRLCSACRVHCD